MGASGLGSCMPGRGETAAGRREPPEKSLGQARGSWEEAGGDPGAGSSARLPGQDVPEQSLPRRRYEKHLEQEEQALQQQRRRLHAEVAEEKERLGQQAAR